MIRLTSFSPICLTKHGRTAIKKFGLEPYIDGSIRREPDLENTYPSITSLCRRSILAPNLSTGDTVIYITKKSKYNLTVSHWKLVAILSVMERLDSHKEAYEWYNEKRIQIPSNCMVKENPPIDLRRTAGLPRDMDSEKEWDQVYFERSKDYPTFLICKPIFLNTKEPIDLFDNVMEQLVGTSRPGTQNPKKLSSEQLESFLKLSHKYHVG